MYPLSNQAPSPAIPHHVIVDELLHSYTSQGGCHWECCVSRFFQNEPCTVSNPTHTPPELPPIYTVQPTLTANFFLDRSHPDGPPPALPSTQNPPPLLSTPSRTTSILDRSHPGPPHNRLSSSPPRPRPPPDRPPDPNILFLKFKNVFILILKILEIKF